MTTTGASDEDLAARVAMLEAENARLRGSGTAPSARRRFSWRAFGSALIIVVAAVLVPVSIVGAWARAELVDETRFVETFAPLAADPGVQSAVTEASVELIDDLADVDATTNALFDGIEGLGVPPDAAAALDLLRAPAAEGLRSLLRAGVSGFVSSDLFADVWSAALRDSHRALVAAVTPGGPAGAVRIDGEGRLSIDLAPVIAEVADHLAANGLPIAAQLPQIDATFVIAQSAGLALVGAVYSLSTAVGFWLPVLSLALFLAGILLARRRRTAVVGTSIGLIVAGAAFLAAAAAGASLVTVAAADLAIPASAAAAVYERVVWGMRQTAIDLLLIGAIAGVLAVLTGLPGLRRAAGRLNGRIRVAIGVEGRPSVEWRRVLGAQRSAIRAALIILTVAAIVLLPVSAAGIVGIVAAALVLWWAAAILELDPVTGAPTAGT